MKWVNRLFHNPGDGAQYRSVPGMDRGDEFQSDKTTTLRPNNWLFSWPSLISRTRLSVTGRVSLLLSMVLVVSVIFSTPTTNELPLSTPTSNSTSNFLHLLIPATSSREHGLCRNVFSAAVLGYPTPRLINWGNTKAPAPGGDEYDGTHLAKITGLLSYLDALGPESDQELILMVDGFDLWFQLPPNVLIDRYQRIVNRHNMRIRRRLGRAMDRQGIRQSIIMNSQNMCWPQDNQAPVCSVVPESEVPPDIYGKGKTDKSPRSTRNRWLNSGFMMGPVGDVRKLLKAVNNMILQTPGRGSDQAAFNEVFGQQEYFRELVRDWHLTAPQRLMARVNSAFGIVDERSKKVLGTKSTFWPTSDIAISDDYEFHLGPDYLSELVQTLDNRAEDMDWHVFSKPEEVVKWTEEKGLPTPVRIGDLPVDIARSEPPFSTLKGYKNATNSGADNDDQGTLEDLNLARRSWSDVRLYTNLYTGVVPSTIHFNRPKYKMDTDWDKIWMFPHLRDLLSARVRAPREPVAVIPEQSGLPRQVWWSPIDSKGGMIGDNSSTPVWVSWEEACNGEAVQDKVFVDEKGLWVDPRSPLPAT
ncbi:hypothetical protein LTR84_008614 [Exophiala bonariae]|uniref:Nucleotide-diphospho-sugar transferase domain-containing protein n=1 Tax=Exophiala bonariae TaxID=1690606 RepID=A0AAV9MWW0_9EURO|nr:hypothetical protein LTR84_008614 [Exophiala bonariae]